MITLYVEGPMGSGKTTRLQQEALRLLETVPVSSVLILCSNHARQQQWIEAILKQQTGALPQLPIYTYAGFVRNALFNFWPLVEQEIATIMKQGQSAIRPELSGLEDSELILRWLLAKLRTEAQSRQQAAFEDFPGTDQHILKQIIRRLRLRSENQLSRKDMQERSVLMGEAYQSEVAWLEKQFDFESYRLRVLDANKQLDIFNSLIKRENPLSHYLRSEIQHLIVDDVDETIPAQQRLIEFLAPSLESLMMAADLDGGSRRGYLNAYPYDWQALKALKPGPTVQLHREDPIYVAAQGLLSNWSQTAQFEPLSPVVQLRDSFLTRIEMLEHCAAEIQTLLEQGAHPGEFCLILPKADALSFYQIQALLARHGLPVQLLSGTKRPSDNPKCRAFISLIQWLNAQAWGVYPSVWEIKTILIQVLQWDRIPGFSQEHLDAISQQMQARQESEDASTDNLLLPPVSQVGHLQLNEGLLEKMRQQYEYLSHWLQETRFLPFEKQLYSAFQALLAPNASENDTFADLNRIIESYLRQKAIFEGLKPSGEALALFPVQDFNRWWLEQVKSGSMADTPETPEGPHPEKILIATAQKVIDQEIYRPYQFWLDVGAREWARSDNAPLYNAWVHSAVWDGSQTAFSEEFNEAVIRTRAGHITRTLMLLATKTVYAYASELDDMGGSQGGLLKPRLLVEQKLTSTSGPERATLRPDQAPVLTYRNRTMAISAVPGAGKTFINVELILELIEQGTQPDRILVLTYMDSAAKTLLSRLKNKLRGIHHNLPVVSTIHSLALRIVSENDHAILAGFLPEDMKILDDFDKEALLARVAMHTQPESTKNLMDWQKAIGRAITHCKTFDIEESDLVEALRRKPNQFRLREFLPAYRLYFQELKQTGSVEFVDLITMAVKILTQYPEVRLKYQQQFTYIIEDEAQDSSHLLQSFITLLGGAQPNLIRTGDTNQSITTTFSSADTSVFRNFVQTAHLKIKMTNSSRCAPEIIDLANFWVRAASTLPGLENAFEPVEMLPVPGKNPTLFAKPETHVFELDAQEASWLVEKISQLREAEPLASIAILVRKNSQAQQIAGLLHQANIPAISLTDHLGMSPVFNLILCTLKLLATPSDLATQTQWHQVQVELGNLLLQENHMALVSEHPLLYLNPSQIQDEQLSQWIYDLLDLRRQAAGGNISTLILRIVERFCHSVPDKSNGYLCALMAQEILANFQHWVHLSPLEILIDRFEAFQKSWKGKKGFGDLLMQQAHQVVQVMSLHKSKGQEFDMVFMPFLQADDFPHQIESIRVQEADKLIQELDRIYADKSKATLPEDYMPQKQREKIEEEARLIYVGLTRAKRALYLSAHTHVVARNNKLRKMEPAKAFVLLQQELNSQNMDALPMQEIQNA